jgi:hypothetical protein
MSMSDQEREQELTELLREVRALRETLDQLKVNQGSQLNPTADYEVLVRAQSFQPPSYNVVVAQVEPLPPSYDVVVRAQSRPPSYEVLVRRGRPDLEESPIVES